jgi:hypothetical protein
MFQVLRPKLHRKYQWISTDHSNRATPKKTSPASGAVCFRGVQSSTWSNDFGPGAKAIDAYVDVRAPLVLHL